MIIIWNGAIYGWGGSGLSKQSNQTKLRFLLPIHLVYVCVPQVIINNWKKENWVSKPRTKQNICKQYCQYYNLIIAYV